jgi:hypothetical protein
LTSSFPVRKSLEQKYAWKIHDFQTNTGITEFGYRREIRWIDLVDVRHRNVRHLGDYRV